MCTGLEILLPLLGSGLGIAGGAIQQGKLNDQAQAQADARNKVLSATLFKNDALADQSRSIFDKRLEEIQPEAFDQQQADLTAERTDTLEGAIGLPDPEDIPISGSAPQVVRSEIAKRMLGAFEKAKGNAQTLGRLGGYGDTFFRQGLATAEAGNQISVPNNFARGNLGILPHLQDFAEVAAIKPISPIGGILSGIGNVLGSFGGSQGYFGGGGGIPAGFPGYPKPKPVNV